MIQSPKPVKPVLHLPQLEANRFNELQTRHWRPGDHFNQSGDTLGVQEEFCKFIPCTNNHWIRRIPIYSNLPYLEQTDINVQQLFSFQIRHEIRTYQAPRKVPRKLSYPLKPSSLSAHTGRLWLSISTDISTLVLGLSTLALPMDSLGDFGPRGLSVQYTQDVCGCPCVYVCVRQHTQNVRGCPSVHISARWPFPWTVWVILANVGCLFSTHRTSVGVGQHTHDVCGCLWLSVSTHKTFVAVRVCPCVSVCVRQHTQEDVRGCPSAHTGRPWVSVSTYRTSVAVRVCPLAHKGRPWLSISTHISTLVLGLSTLTLPVDCSGDFGPRGLSVQYTQDVRRCPSAHRGRPCVSVSTYRTSVAVRVCLCVSVSTHRTYVAVHQYTYQHVGPWSQHADPSRGLFG
ncbi:hypothetical protein YC2023_108224 [Brassica napus]